MILIVKTCYKAINSPNPYTKLIYLSIYVIHDVSVELCYPSCCSLSEKRPSLFAPNREFPQHELFEARPQAKL